MVAGILIELGGFMDETRERVLARLNIDHFLRSTFGAEGRSPLVFNIDSIVLVTTKMLLTVLDLDL